MDESRSSLQVFLRDDPLGLEDQPVATAEDSDFVFKVAVI